jgi:hypothetical protein
MKNKNDKMRKKGSAPKREATAPSLEHDERFLKWIGQSREQARGGRFVRLEDLVSKA